MKLSFVQTIGMLIALPVLFSCAKTIEDGYQPISTEKVKTISITMHYPPGTAELNKTFSDPAKVKSILAMLNLGQHQDLGGLPAAVYEGEILLGFEDRNLNARTLHVIANGTRLLDESFKQIAYRPTQKIDRAWLEQQ
jgi:hypothetical protein